MNRSGRLINTRGLKETEWLCGFSILLKMLLQKYPEIDRKLCFAVKDLGKAYGRGDRKGLWDVPRICVVGGSYLEGIIYFYKDASAHVLVKVSAAL